MRTYEYNGITLYLEGYEESADCEYGECWGRMASNDIPAYFVTESVTVDTNTNIVELFLDSGKEDLLTIIGEAMKSVGEYELTLSFTKGITYRFIGEKGQDAEETVNEVYAIKGELDEWLTEFLDEKFSELVD